MKDSEMLAFFDSEQCKACPHNVECAQLLLEHLLLAYVMFKFEQGGIN